MKPLRILVVLPLYGGSLPIGRYCVQALRNLGYSTRVFDAPAMYEGYKGLRQLDLSPARLPVLENSYLRLVSQAIWMQAQEQKPDLVLAMAQAPLDRPTLARMREAGIRTVMWFVEDFRLFTYWQMYAPLYDAFAVIQKEPFLEKLATIGQKHAFYLPLAALPDFHKPLDLSADEKKEFGSALSFLGAGYPNRRLAFRPLADKDFKIWGNDWDDEKTLAKNMQRGGQRINEEDAVKIYNATNINLNLHSSINSENLVGNGDFVNPRTFELAAMGKFQLVDKRSLMPELFADNELATFSTIEEFYNKIDYFLAHPQEAEEIAMRGRKRVLAEHTYEKRMRALIEYMQKHCGLEVENVESGGNVDEEDRKIAELAAKLDLSPDAAFDDVVARLRQQSGELNEFETAILFLAEWKKQYASDHKEVNSRK